MPEATLPTEWTAKPGAEEALGAALAELCRWARAAEPGCRAHAVLRAGSGRFLTLGRYADARAAATHRSTPHFQRIALAAVAGRLLADQRTTVWDAAEPDTLS